MSVGKSSLVTPKTAFIKHSFVYLTNASGHIESTGENNCNYIKYPSLHTKKKHAALFSAKKKKHNLHQLLLDAVHMSHSLVAEAVLELLGSKNIFT